MPTHHQSHQTGRLAFTALCLIVLAFMALSLAITATGTARFAMAMGLPQGVGYAVGALFDLAKAIVPVGLLALFARRAYSSFVVVGVAWIGLVTYSALATHATVGLAISSIERAAAWNMESRSDERAELEMIERRLKALSQPSPPRPSKSIVEALAGEQVPAGVWRKSNECQQIRRSSYFQKACATVLELRAELAAAKDYEQLDVRAQMLRRALMTSPILATSDPLPQAFANTVGRMVQVDGTVGIALLLTMVTEIFSCFGLAAVRRLGERKSLPSNAVFDDNPLRNPTAIPDFAKAIPRAGQGLSAGLPQSSLTALDARSARAPSRTKKDAPSAPSNVIAIRGRHPKGSTARDVQRRSLRASPRAVTTGVNSNVPEFVRDRMRPSVGLSIGASELLAAYEDWCAAQGKKPRSQKKLGADLARLGLTKWKSCGRIRYRDVQLAA